MSPAVRALVVDDEPPARQRIIQLLKSTPEISVAAQCRNGEEAVRQILKFRPDVIFLDIQMPRMDGFEVVQSVGVERMPPVVFVTAYDRYALKAFDASAVDYLLKPYSPDRFEEALRKALREVEQRRRSTPRKLDNLLERLRHDGRLEDRILVQSSHRVDIVRVADIQWIEAAGNYVTLHVGKRQHLLRESMKGLLDRLDESVFVRVHRSYIVNKRMVDRLDRLSSGDYEVRLQDGRTVPGSRRYASGFLHALSS